MVSILMPVYNAAPFLKECIDSIIKQTYSNWELIAVDDYSTDTSKSILKEYAAKDQRIRVLENQEKGIIPALRLALEQSKGELITRMDADDIMPVEKLSLMANAVQNESVVTGKVEYFRSDGELGDGYTRYATWLNGLVETASHWNEIYKECVIPSPAWMMTRETLEDIGAFSSDTYPEDYDLVFKMYKHDLKVMCVDEVIHLWRDHSTRASRNDPNYSDNRFLDLKLSHFLSIDHDIDRPLAIWGAGTKGKYVARQIGESGNKFTWHTDNPKKQDLEIYGTVLSAATKIPQNSQVLLCMASPQDQAEVKQWLKTRTDLRPFWLT